MILEFSDWLFLVNVESNKTYSTEEAESHCTCTWCRNFYRTVNHAYPDLRYFLSRFGLDIEAPESLQPITPELYQASYIAEGKILRQGSEPIYINELPITVEPCDEPEYFELQVGLMKLPWVMKEDPATLPTPAGLPDLFSDFKNRQQKIAQQ